MKRKKRGKLKSKQYESEKRVLNALKLFYPVYSNVNINDAAGCIVGWCLGDTDNGNAASAICNYETATTKQS